jgi:hypothetical protein
MTDNLTYHEPSSPFRSGICLDWSPIAPSGLLPVYQDMFVRWACDMPCSDLEKEILEILNSNSTITFDKRKNLHKSITSSTFTDETKRYLYGLVDRIPGSDSTCSFGVHSHETEEYTEIVSGAFTFLYPHKNTSIIKFRQ